MPGERPGVTRRSIHRFLVASVPGGLALRGGWPSWTRPSRRPEASGIAHAAPAASGGEYEYIVVGSGAGGGTVAARLAERGHTVLLLEAGGDEAPWSYRVPVFHGLATEDEDMRLDHYVRHYADEARQERDPKYLVERGAGRHGVYYPRARTLGGCTAHYAMIIVRPHDSDWRAIRDATGDASWAPGKMQEYFERVERCLYREDASGGHGRKGWLPTRFADVFDFLSEQIRARDFSIGQIAVESLGADLGRLPICPWDRPFFGRDRARAKIDPNDQRVVSRRGVGLVAVPTAIDEDGHRAGTRERIQAVQAGGRLHVRTHCHVTGLVFDDHDPLRAVGVRYLPGERLYRAERDPARVGRPTGPAQEVRATREVILSAGAYITPQLLMLSGIGPADELRRHGIEVRLDRPGVGRNLQDRYEVGVVARAGKRFDLLEGATFRGPAPGREGDRLFEAWRAGGTGLYATNGAVLGFLARSSVAEHDEPDLFVFGVPGSFTGYYTGWSAEAVAEPYDKWTWLLLKAHARFRGRVTLQSTDPLDPPAIDFNYFERGPDGMLTTDAARDLVAMREGVRLIMQLLDASTQLTLHPEIMRGIDLATDAGIDRFVQDRAWGHHASCTCKIGGASDPEAVLDGSFRVHGVKGLRVVDASVFPRIPGFFVAMPIYMIAEKAADAIHADARAGR
jgi:choline dehydrogenase-like flavoprotein